MLKTVSGNRQNVPERKVAAKKSKMKKHSLPKVLSSQNVKGPLIGKYRYQKAPEMKIRQGKTESCDDTFSDALSNHSNKAENTEKQSEVTAPDISLNDQETKNGSGINDEESDTDDNKGSSMKFDNNQRAEKHMSSDTLYNTKFTAPLKKKRRFVYNPTEEARLERIVFGDPSDIIKKLATEDTVSTAQKDIDKSDNAKEVVEDVVTDSTDVSDTEETNDDPIRKPAWTDEDDTQYSVDAALDAQNRKLSVKRPERTYLELLQNNYRQLVGTPKWAEIDKTETDDLEDDILKHSCHLEVSKQKTLPKNTIEIKALTAINRETHNEGPIVTCVEFHQSSTVALVGGSSGILSIFQVDGIENNKLHSMHFKKFPISKAVFLREGTEILVGSQYHSHCHTYNLLTGKTHRIPLPHGITSMKRYEISPDGKLIALCGRLGEIYLLASSTKELVGTLKMNDKCKTIAFTPDSKTLITHGDGNEMYIWDVNSRKCIHRATDDGCLSCSSINVSPSGQFLATGSKQGVVNIYDVKTVLQEKVPKPLKIVLNLVTPITSLKFNPTSEILAMASDEKQNAFKMLHIPSFNVFPNFPTFQTTMGMPCAIDFSPGSGYLSISNKSNSALLYRLKHYGNY